jgi:hypothetical protein
MRKYYLELGRFEMLKESNEKTIEIPVKALFDTFEYRDSRLNREDKWVKAYSEGWKFSTLRGVFWKEVEFVIEFENTLEGSSNGILTNPIKEFKIEQRKSK